MRYNPLVLILLLLFPVAAKATTWSPAYPYIQRTENGKVRSHSVPYGVRDGPYGLGQTFIYAGGKLLYTIDKYFSTPFFTTGNGLYLISFDFSLYYRGKLLVDDSGRMKPEYEGEAVHIYKGGQLMKTIHFSELKIDTSRIYVNSDRNFFDWNYRVSNTEKDKMKLKMYRYPTFIEHDTLYLITADDQLIAIDIASGEIVVRRDAYETLKQKADWKPTRLKREYQKVKYPEQFLLPDLYDGRTFEQALATFLGTSVADRDSALIQLYVHTLLINKNGRCEDVYVSPYTRSDAQKNFPPMSNDEVLKGKVEKWIRQQTFATKTMPTGFPKYKYSDFVYLR